MGKLLYLLSPKAKRLGTKGSEDSENFFEQTKLYNMEKYRIAFTVQDYFEYTGVSPYLSIKERMLRSIPDLFKENGYNIKFKRVHNELFPWYTYYRVHISVRMSEQEIKRVFNMNTLYNVSYKLITKHF